MQSEPDLPGAKSSVFESVALALGFGILHFLCHGLAGIDFGDEGFYDYGVLRVLAGEIPGVDFQAYDGLRYYWGALFASVFGDGLLVVRAGASAFAALGIGVALRVLARLGPCRGVWLIAAFLLVLWMRPWYRSFDVVAPLLAVFACLRLLEGKSSRRGALIAGLVFGALCWLGRNHALYAALALGASFTIASSGMSLGDRGRVLTSMGVGALIGALPILLSALLVPDYLAELYGPTLHRIGQTGATNLSKPVPWPWIEFRLGVFFLALPTLFGAAALALLRGRFGPPIRNVVLASFIGGLPYLHYAFSRPDLTHLAVAMSPSLLLAVAWLQPPRPPYPIARRALLSLLVFASLAIVGLRAPGYRLLTREMQPREIRGSTIWMRAEEAAQLDAFARVASLSEANPASLFAAPNLPGIYATQGLRAPTWDLYLLWQRSVEAQRAAVAALEENDVEWVVLADRPVDGRADLCLSAISPELWAHLTRHYGASDEVEMPRDDLLVWRRKPAGQIHEVAVSVPEPDADGVRCSRLP